MKISPIYKKGGQTIEGIKLPSYLTALHTDKSFLRIVKIENSLRYICISSGKRDCRRNFHCRQIIEKARDKKVPLHFHFIDFKSAFDMIWRQALWNMLKVIGVKEKHPKNYVSKHSIYCHEWFKVEVGVQQGCILSPTLFNIFLELKLMMLPV